MLTTWPARLGDHRVRKTWLPVTVLFLMRACWKIHIQRWVYNRMGGIKKPFKLRHDFLVKTAEGRHKCWFNFSEENLFINKYAWPPFFSSLPVSMNQRSYESFLNYSFFQALMRKRRWAIQWYRVAVNFAHSLWPDQRSPTWMHHAACVAKFSSLTRAAFEVGAWLNTFFAWASRG